MLGFKNLLFWLRHLTNKQEQIAYFFEAGDGHDAELLQVEREILAEPRATDVYRFQSMTIVAEDKLPQLQPADWLAWEAAKYLKDTRLRPVDPRQPRASLLKLNNPGKLSSLWYDEKKLIELRDARRRGEAKL